MSEKEEVKLEHPYSDIVGYKLVAGRILTREEIQLEENVNQALANQWEILWMPSLTGKDVIQMARRATTFVPASTLAKESQVRSPAQVLEGLSDTTGPKQYRSMSAEKEETSEGLSSVIGTITADSKNATVQARVIAAPEAKVTGSGKTVQNLLIEDLSGKIRLVLWGEDCGVFQEGDRIEVEKGYVTVNSFGGRDEVQLSKGKYGKVRKLA